MYSSLFISYKNYESHISVILIINPPAIKYTFDTDKKEKTNIYNTKTTVKHSKDKILLTSRFSSC